MKLLIGIIEHSWYIKINIEWDNKYKLIILLYSENYIQNIRCIYIYIKLK